MIHSSVFRDKTAKGLFLCTLPGNQLKDDEKEIKPSMMK